MNIIQATDSKQLDIMHSIKKISRLGQRCGTAVLLANLIIFSASEAISAGTSASGPEGPSSELHYAPNGNFGSRGQYLPAKAGFNLADVSSVAQLNALPHDVKGLVWIGQCSGVDTRFIMTVKPYIGNAKLFGFYLMDDPDPRPLSGLLARQNYCPPANLKAQSDWIHEHVPGAKTFILPMNMGSRQSPSFENTYNPSNTGVDLYGIDPYPCLSELAGCDYEMIERFVRVAEASGIPRNQMVPVYQTFGGGEWKDELGGKYTMPTSAQLKEMLARWGALIGKPQFDFAYSWGSQRSDLALEGSEELQQTVSFHNRTSSAR